MDAVDGSGYVEPRAFSHLLSAFDAEREGMAKLECIHMTDKRGKTALGLATPRRRIQKTSLITKAPAAQWSYEPMPN
jgi:hypothetical protein